MIRSDLIVLVEPGSAVIRRGQGACPVEAVSIAGISRNRVAPDAAAWGIRAFSGGSPEPLTDEHLAWRAEAVPHTLDLIADGRFRVDIGRRFALDDAGDAHRLIESGSPGGKVLIVP